jgi:Protein of unknown function (DUF2934)
MQNKGSHTENHPRTVGLQDTSEHAHLTASERRGEQDHKTGHEASRQAMEHSRQAYLSGQENDPKGTNEHGFPIFGHHEIEALAHELWVARGCPVGSPEIDWSAAVAQLRSRKQIH